MYLHPKNRSVSFQKRPKMFCSHHFQVFTRCCFQNVSVRVPFSKSTVFNNCRQKMCRFRLNGSPIRHNCHRFQNVLASCGHSLSFAQPFVSHASSKLLAAIELETKAFLQKLLEISRGGGGVHLTRFWSGTCHRGFKNVPVPHTKFLKKYTRTYTNLSRKYRVSQKKYPLLTGNRNEAIRYHYSPSS